MRAYYDDTKCQIKLQSEFIQQSMYLINGTLKYLKIPFIKLKKGEHSKNLNHYKLSIHIYMIQLENDL